MIVFHFFSFSLFFSLSPCQESSSQNLFEIGFKSITLWPISVCVCVCVCVCGREQESEEETEGEVCLETMLSGVRGREVFRDDVEWCERCLETMLSGVRGRWCV